MTTARIRRNGTVLEALLGVPGVTIPALQQAIYHLRARQGGCARYPCKEQPEPGKTMCETHRTAALKRTKSSKERKVAE